MIRWAERKPITMSHSARLLYADIGSQK